MAEIPSTYEELLAKYLQLLAQVSPAEEQVPTLTPPQQESPNPNEETPSVQEVQPVQEKAEIDVVLPVTPSPSPSTTFFIADSYSVFGVHPLLTEPILRHLGPFIDHKSLRSCRQVCSKWYIFLTPAFLKKSKLVAKFSKDRNERRRDSDFSSSDESDSEYDVEGWRSMKNFIQIYPFPSTPRSLDDTAPSTSTSQNDENSKDPSETFQDLRAFYWESRARPELLQELRTLCLESLAKPDAQSNSSKTAIRLRSLSIHVAMSRNGEAGQIEIPMPTRFDLGFELDDKKFFIPSPPVPETLELIGNTCPTEWLKTYGYLIKNLQIDFGNFQRRDRFGDMEAAFLVKLLKIYCPKVETLCVLKPNYTLDNAQPPLPSTEARSSQAPPDNSLLMSTARFENITTLEIRTYRSDRIQCVKEILAATVNVKHLSLSMFSIPPEAEREYIETLINAGHIKNLQSLKFPMGIKSTTLVLLLGVEFTALREVMLGRIRQTRWIRAANPLERNAPFVEQGALSEFLQNVSGTLEALSIVVNLTHPDEIWIALTATDIPIMPYLRKLEYKYVRPEFAENFNFLDNLPSLTELNLTAESQNAELVARKLFDSYFGINQNLTTFIASNCTVEFSIVVKLTRSFPRLKVLHIILPLASTDVGNGNVRRPFSRFLFKFRKLSELQELRVKCSVIEKDDFSYSVGFSFRYLRALRKFAFNSVKTVPRLTPFAVEMGFLKATSLISVELENFIIYAEDRPQIEAALKKKLLFTKFINCFVVNPLKDTTEPETKERHEDSLFNIEPQIISAVEKWSYRVERYTDFESLARSASQAPELNTMSNLTFSASDADSLEFAVASL